MNTELLIDTALIILAFLYLGVARCWWLEIEATKKHRVDMLVLERTTARARQLRERLEMGRWS